MNLSVNYCATGIIRAVDTKLALTKDMSMRLCLFYMRELRSLCGTDKDGGDLEGFMGGRGRGHRILRFLERGYRESGEEAVWWNGEFVDLIINLYQASTVHYLFSDILIKCLQ